MLAALGVFLISLPQGPWAMALPVIAGFPLLLWIAVRTRQVFAAAAALVVALTLFTSTTFNVGPFGEASIPLSDRILAAQTAVLMGDLIPYELGGRVDLAFARDGLRCRVEIPSDYVGRGNRRTANSKELPSPPTISST
jgi:hypothetical protein